MFFGSVYEYIAGSPNCTKFLEVVDQSETLSKNGNVSVFVPNNKAFELVEEERMRRVKSEPGLFVSAHLTGGYPFLILALFYSFSKTCL